MFFEGVIPLKLFSERASINVRCRVRKGSAVGPGLSLRFAKVQEILATPTGIPEHAFEQCVVFQVAFYIIWYKAAHLFLTHSIPVLNADRPEVGTKWDLLI